MTMQAMVAPAWQIPMSFPGWQPWAPQQALYCGEMLTIANILPAKEERTHLDPDGARRLICGVLVQARRDANHNKGIQETEELAAQIRAEARAWLLSEDGGLLFAEALGMDARLIERQAAAGWPDIGRFSSVGVRKGPKNELKRN